MPYCPYSPPQRSVDFQFQGKPYVVASDAIANFDGSVTVAFNPAPALMVSHSAPWQQGVSSERHQHSHYQADSRNPLHSNQSPEQSAASCRIGFVMGQDA